MTARGRAEVALYRRNAAHLTHRRVLHELEKQDEIASFPRLRRRSARAELALEWDEEERLAAEEAAVALLRLREAAEAFASSLGTLSQLDFPGLRGKVEPETQRVAAVIASLDEAADALARRDFGAAGGAADKAARELWLAGGPLVVVLNEALGRAAIGRAHRDALHDNVSARQAAKASLEQARLAGPAAAIEAAAE
ncbi:MAG: hypothetical protein M3229_04395, partial [Actinomycetota bacterium]|nr:hypothetical protein [Actinomycetota bacterium]